METLKLYRWVDLKASLYSKPLKQRRQEPNRQHQAVETRAIVDEDLTGATKAAPYLLQTGATAKHKGREKAAGIRGTFRSPLLFAAVRMTRAWAA